MLIERALTWPAALPKALLKSGSIFFKNIGHVRKLKITTFLG